MFIKRSQFREDSDSDEEELSNSEYNLLVDEIKNNIIKIKTKISDSDKYHYKYLKYKQKYSLLL
jgi:hypothetical protein